MTTNSSWGFQIIESDRAQKLSREVVFGALIETLSSEMYAVSFRKEAGRNEAKGWWRPVFHFQVQRPTFDYFFNSVFGYRGQYYRDPSRGDNANAQLLEALVDPLLVFVDEAVVSRSVVQRSVVSKDAKIWIDEDEHYPQQPILLVEIVVPEWKAAAEDARRRLDASQHITAKEVDRIFGIRAPQGTRLEVKGAWVGDDGQLHRTEGKINRAQDIHAFGVS